MDAQILVALIGGLFGAIIAPLVAQIVIPILRARWTSVRRSRRSRKHEPALQSKLIALGGLSGLLLGYVIVGTPCPPFAPPSAEITSPVDGETVPILTIMEGTSCHIPKEKELWSVVVPSGVTGLHPQEGPIAIPADDLWSTSVYVGLDQPEDVGRGFTLMVVLVDREGSRVFRNALDQGEPLESLPKGARLLTQVTVVRR